MRVTISNEGVNITKRFFLALDTLQVKREIRGVKTFTDKYGINYWNLDTLRKEPEKRILKAEFLSHLCRDFNVSAEWLLLGVGTMFKNNETPSSGDVLPE